MAAMDATERRVIAGLVADVAELLGAPLLGSPAGDDAGARPGAVVGGSGEAAPSGADAWAGPGGWASWPSEAPAAPSDPAVARLLPSASADDGALAAEFRRLTEADLRAGKVANLRLVWESLRGPAGRLVVAEPDALRWAAALTDVRLVLADRLGIASAADADRVYAGAGAATGDDAADALATVYSVLTWLQETLVQAMLGGPGRPVGEH